MEIKLDAEAVAGIASAAIFDAMSADMRESVIKQAVQYLLTPEENRGRFGPGKTPLQNAFDQAIQQVAYKVVKERIEEDPVISEHIQSLIHPLMTQALNAEAVDYETTLADAIGSAMGSWLSELARKRREGR
jgi:hypothetical protein